jgi:hypothetical protein
MTSFADDRPPFPGEPRDDETDNEYRARLRAWFDAVPDGPTDGPGFRRAEWEYICSLAGVDPDDAVEP